MQIIIKLGILLAVLLSSLFGFSQSNADKIYDSLSGEDGVTTLSFSKSVLKPFEFFIDEDSKKVIYKMEKVRFLAYNENKGHVRASKVHNRIIDKLQGKGYFEIDPDELEHEDFDVNFDDGDDVQLFGHGKRKKMDEVHILVYDQNDCVLVSFYGDITIDDIKQCGKFTHSTRNMIEM